MIPRGTKLIYKMDPFLRVIRAGGEGPQAPMLTLALQWHEQEDGVDRPVLREDSVLGAVELNRLDSEEWDSGEWPGPTRPPPSDWPSFARK